MAYAVRLEEVAARPLAVARGATVRSELGATIVKLLDQVWPVLRAQSVTTGQNVVMYLGAQTSDTTWPDQAGKSTATGTPTRGNCGPISISC